MPGAGAQRRGPALAGRAGTNCPLLAGGGAPVKQTGREGTKARLYLSGRAEDQKNEIKSDLRLNQRAGTCSQQWLPPPVRTGVLRPQQHPYPASESKTKNHTLVTGPKTRDGSNAQPSHVNTEPDPRVPPRSPCSLPPRGAAGWRGVPCPPRAGSGSAPRRALRRARCCTLTPSEVMLVVGEPCSGVRAIRGAQTEPRGAFACSAADGAADSQRY